MGILDKILKPKDKKRKYSDDDYIRTSLIYNEEDNRNLIILLSFTENYFADAIDLLSSSTLTTKALTPSLNSTTIPGLMSFFVIIL